MSTHRTKLQERGEPGEIRSPPTVGCGMLSRVISIRVLTADDWPTWRALRLAALEEAPYAFGSRLTDWQGDGDREDRWRSRLEIPGGHDVVACLDEEPVGMASGVPTDREGEVELISMWVAPPARGRGVADALVEEVERWAAGVGAATCRLSVADGNDAAMRLYLRRGFRPTGEVDVMPDGVRRERVMAKTLDGTVRGVARATPGTPLP